MRHWRIEPGAAWQGYATRGARMLQGGQLPRQGTAEQQEPSLAELLDPVALEARLAEARVRRAEAIARRAGVGATESARPERRPLVGHDTLRKGAAGPPKNVEHLEARQLSSTPPLRAEPGSVAWASKTTVSFPKPKAAPSDHADSRFGLPAALPPAAERARPRAAAPWLGRHAGGMALVLGIAIGVVGTSAALLSVPPPFWQWSAEPIGPPPGATADGTQALPVSSAPAAMPAPEAPPPASFADPIAAQAVPAPDEMELGYALPAPLPGISAPDRGLTPSAPLPAISIAPPAAPDVPTEIALPDSLPALRGVSVPAEDRAPQQQGQRIVAAVATPFAPLPAISIVPPAAPMFPTEIALPDSLPALHGVAVPAEDRASQQQGRSIVAAVAPPSAALPAVAAIPIGGLPAQRSAMPTDAALHPLPQPHLPAAHPETGTAVALALPDSPPASISVGGQHAPGLPLAVPAPPPAEVEAGAKPAAVSTEAAGVPSPPKLIFRGTLLDGLDHATLALLTDPALGGYPLPAPSPAPSAPEDQPSPEPARTRPPAAAPKPAPARTAASRPPAPAPAVPARRGVSERAVEDMLRDRLLRD